MIFNLQLKGAFWLTLIKTKPGGNPSFRSKLNTILIPGSFRFIVQLREKKMYLYSLNLKLYIEDIKMALPINNIKFIKLYYFTRSNSGKCCVYHAAGTKNFRLFPTTKRA